jgi:hypothetical protein
VSNERIHSKTAVNYLLHTATTLPISFPLWRHIFVNMANSVLPRYLHHAEWDIMGNHGPKKEALTTVFHYDPRISMDRRRCAKSSIFLQRSPPPHHPPWVEAIRQVWATTRRMHNGADSQSRLRALECRNFRFRMSGNQKYDHVRLDELMIVGKKGSCTELANRCIAIFPQVPQNS